MRRSAARRRAPERRAPKARRQQKFVASHLDPDAFKADGLRTYAQYRDLGVKDATRGMALAHVVRFVGNVRSEGRVEEAHARVRVPDDLRAQGHDQNRDRRPRRPHHERRRFWLQPQSIVHKVLDYSDGCEVLEIVLPAEFKTVELEK